MIRELKIVLDDIACRQPVEPVSDEQIDAWPGRPR